MSYDARQGAALADGGSPRGDFGKHVGWQSCITLLLGDSLPAGVDPLQVIGDGTTSFGIGSDRRNIKPGEARDRVALFAGSVGERNTKISRFLAVGRGSGCGNRLGRGFDECSGGVPDAGCTRAGTDSQVQFGVTNRTWSGMQLAHELL